MSEKEYVGVREASKIYGLSAQYLYTLRRGRALPFYQLRGKKILFKRADIEEYLNECRIVK